MAWRSLRDWALSGLGALFPQHAGEFSLWGFPVPGGNMGDEENYLDSLTLESLLESFRAFYYAATGNESSGLAAANTGHKHDEGYDSVMPWRALDSWRFFTGFSVQGGPGHRDTAETTETRCAFVGFVLPAGATMARASCMVLTQNDQNQLSVRFRYYAPTDVNTVAVDGGYVTANGSNSSGVICPLGSLVDLSGIATTGGKRIVFVRVDVFVTGNTLGLYDVELLLPDGGARPYTRVDLDTTKAIPDLTLPQATLKNLIYDFLTYGRTLIFGSTYPLPKKRMRHNHGAQRGLVLDRHILSTSYGPHTREGTGATSGGTIGVPLQEPAAGVDFTLSTSPKLISVEGRHFLGGVGELKGYACVYLPGGGAETITLKVEVRPISDHGYDPGAHLGVVATVILTAGAGADFQVGAFTIDLSTLGHVGEDRFFEVCLWMVSNAPVASAYRLTGLLGYPGTAPAQLPEPVLPTPPRKTVSPGQLRQGQILSVPSARLWWGALNELTQELLGGVPALQPDLKTPDTTDPWRKLLDMDCGQHQHRGTFTDERGKRVDDGSPIRWGWASSYPVAVNGLSGGVEPATATADASLGAPLHSTGVIGGGLPFTHRVTLPLGLGAIWVRALIQPGHSKADSRLFVEAILMPQKNRLLAPSVSVDGQITKVLCGAFQSTGSSVKTGSTICLVDAEDGDAWIPRARTISWWTNDALRPLAVLPSGLRTTNAGRWTQPIRIEYTPYFTGEHQLQLRFLLQSGIYQLPTAGTWETGARCMGISVQPAEGY